jgi:hypothetical protein
VEGWVANALFLTFVSAWLAVGLVLARRGWPMPTAEIAIAWCYCVIFAFSPLLFGRAAGWSFLAGPLLLLVLCPFVLVIGRGGYAIVLLVALATAWRLRQVLPVKVPTKQIILSAVLSLAMAYFLFAQLHGGTLVFASAWLPEYAVSGIETIDGYYHAAITNMIAKFGIPSTGLDGALRHYYHVASHYFFAGFGVLLGRDALTVYMIVQIVVILPLMFWALGAAIIWSTAGAVGWITILTSLCAFLLLLHASLVKAYVFLSESFAASLIVLAMAAAILIGYVRGRISPAAMAGVTSVLILVMAAVKGPTALTWLGISGYVVLRSEGLRYTTIAWLSMLILAFLLPSYFLLVTGGTGNIVIGTATSIFKASPSWDEIPGMLVLTPVVVLAVVLCRHRVVSEVLMIAIVVSVALAMWAYSATYFFIVVVWFAFVVVGSNLGGLFVPPSVALLTAAALVLASSWTTHGFHLPASRAHGFIVARSAVEGQVSVGEQVRMIVAASPASVVFVDPLNLDFWNVVEGQCDAAAFFIPAVTGRPMLKGLPPGSCPLKWYGFENYSADARSSPMTDAALCARASTKGFYSVLILSSVMGSQSGRDLNCKPLAGRS